MWCAICNNIYMDLRLEFWLNMQLLTKMPFFYKNCLWYTPNFAFYNIWKEIEHPFFPIKFEAGKYLVFFVLFCFFCFVLLLFFFLFFVLFLENLLLDTRLEGRSSEEIRVHAVQTGLPFLKILNLLSLSSLSFYSCTTYSSLFWFCFSDMDRHAWSWRRRPVHVFGWYSGGFRKLVYRTTRQCI